MTIKIFTMVKDEVDIIREWIVFHSELFGYENIHIIDNYSTDGTYEIIEEYKDKIHIFREKSYLKKGIFMKNIIDKFCDSSNIAFPIDIDEFIVYYDNKIIVDKKTINDYINNLPDAYVYKANYISTIITDKTDYGYNNAVLECKYGNYDDYGQNAKTFFKVKNYNGSIDHGNHINTINYHLSKICLVHYHLRNLTQIKKKIYNNVIGLGYPDDLNKLKNIIQNNNDCCGNHHVSNYIHILENTFELQTYNYHSSNIELTPLFTFICQS